ncbi:MAG: VOC family protein [Pseudomonadota bacterium]
MATISGFDHLVLTVRSIDATVRFYQALGMSKVVFGPQERVALAFGDHKINLHEAGREFEPKAIAPTPGSADLCFIVDDLDAMASKLAAEAVPLLEGPVTRTGARGPIRSLYVRDPDGNLIELSVYEP